MLDELPRPNASRLAVRVTPDALRQIRGGSPWLYDGSITSVNRSDGAPGDLAVIFDRDRNFAAIGLWDPASPIRVKVVHVGKPVTIDAAFWQQRTAAALDRRAPLVDQGDTTGWRWVNGEGDALPGLVIDRYGTSVVVKLYSTAWFAHLREVIAAVERLAHPLRVVLRLARTITDHAARLGITDGDTVSGVAVDEPAEFVEHGLDFAADIVAGQKTGHFLDQRDNREALRTLIHRAGGGQHVLDVFASTGGFSVYAAAGGAASVTSVDISEPTLAAAAENMQRNVHLDAVRQCRHDLVAGDAFEVMQRMVRNGRRFDVVVVDPPSFAQRQDSVDGALRAYARLTESACRLLVPDGVLVQASCSSRVPADRFYAGVRSAAQLAGFDLVERSRRGHAIDHPVVTREGEYLRCLVANVTRLA